MSEETTKPKPGRPKWIPSKHDMENAFEFASIGLTEEQIAHNLGVSYDTLNERKNEFPEFSNTIKKGKAHGIQKVANKLFDQAMKGNLGAQIFYLKARAGWKETNVSEVTGENGKPIEIKSQEITNNLIKDTLSTILKKKD